MNLRKLEWRRYGIPISPAVEQSRDAVSLGAELEKIADEWKGCWSRWILGVVLALLVEVSGDERRTAGYSYYYRQVILH